jgi:hypothetical protein
VELTGKHAACSVSQQRRGYRVFVVDLERKEWFNVAKGLLTPAFWRSQCTARQGAKRATHCCLHVALQRLTKAAPLRAPHGHPA